MICCCLCIIQILGSIGLLTSAGQSIFTPPIAIVTNSYIDFGGWWHYCCWMLITCVDCLYALERSMDECALFLLPRVVQQPLLKRKKSSTNEITRTFIQLNPLNFLFSSDHEDGLRDKPPFAADGEVGEMVLCLKTILIDELL